MITPTASEQSSLSAALAAEHAAIYAYGVVAAYANPTRSDQVDADVAAHRALRDALVDSLTSAGLEAAPAAAGYATPFPVVDPPSAAQLAAQTEFDVSVAWRSVVENGETAETRTFAVDALAATAVRAALWRSVLGVDPWTLAFPGLPA
ncbi:ferritin-like domain-containing protein [Rhodococcus sp. NPDC058521]|uniref:ferritin-like domain-containing protein n=1 Tax=Rhodococcus sp. NPDC058521 TaxID=3346536 RepID=UPI003647E779